MQSQKNAEEDIKNIKKLTENNTCNEKQRWILGDDKAPKILRIAILVFSWILAISSIYLIMFMDAYNPIFRVALISFVIFFSFSTSYYLILKKDLINNHGYHRNLLNVEFIPFILLLLLFLKLMFEYTDNNTYPMLFYILIIGSFIITILSGVQELLKIDIRNKLKIAKKTLKQNWFLEKDRTHTLCLVVLISAFILVAGIIWLAYVIDINLLAKFCKDNGRCWVFPPWLLLIVVLLFIIYKTIFKKDWELALMALIIGLLALFLSLLSMYTNNEVYIIIYFCVLLFCIILWLKN